MFALHSACYVAGVYVIEDPPPAPKVAAPAVANTTANVTRGPQLPAAGKNLMV